MPSKPSSPSIPADSPPPPSRVEYDAAPKTYLARGAPFKADVTSVDLGAGAIVVKDFRPRAWWRRVIGRLEIDRERRAYAYLGPLPWLPRFLGRIDADALAVELVEGVPLAQAEGRGRWRHELLEQIRAALAHFGEVGFLHLDARNSKNLLLARDGRVVFIDLAGSYWVRPGGLGHRLLRPFFDLYHEATVIKWETLLHPDGDPRWGRKKPPRYVHGLSDLWTAWQRTRARRRSSVERQQRQR